MKISTPLEIKSLTIHNRLVRSSTWEGLAARDGGCTEALSDYLGTLVSGKVGLLITGFAFIHRSGIVLPYMTGIEDDSRIEGLRKLTDHVHRLGGKIAIQLSHGGAKSRPELIGDHTIIWWNASAGPRPGVVWRDLTRFRSRPAMGIS